MLRSATNDFSRCVSSLSTSASRAFRLAAPPSKNCSRQPDNVAAVTPSSRERVSGLPHAAAAALRHTCVSPTTAPGRRAALREPLRSPSGLPPWLPKLLLSPCSYPPPRDL